MNVNFKENIECLNDDRIRWLHKELKDEPVGTDRYLVLSSELTQRMSEYNKVKEIVAEEVKAAESRDLEEKRIRFDKIKTGLELGTSAILTFVCIAYDKFKTNLTFKFEKDGYVGNSLVWRQKVDKPFIFRMKR